MKSGVVAVIVFAAVVLVSLSLPFWFGDLYSSLFPGTIVRESVTGDAVLSTTTTPVTSALRARMYDSSQNPPLLLYTGRVFVYTLNGDYISSANHVRGFAQISNLSVGGQYRVVATAPGYRNETGYIIIRPGNLTRMNFFILPSASLRVQVLDIETNGSVNSTQISVYNSSGDAVIYQSSFRGTNIAQFSNLAFGQYIIEVSAPGYVTRKQPITIQETLKRVTIFLTRPSFSFVSNNPRLGNGRVDIDKTLSYIHDLNMDEYLFWPGRAAAGYRRDYDDMGLLLQRLKSTNDDTSIILYLLGFNLGSQSPYGKVYTSWAGNASLLSLSYPNLKGILLDDFFAVNDNGESFTPTYLKQVCSAARSQNPDFKIYALLYCGYFGSHQSVDQIDRFIQLRESDPQLRSCLTGVHIYEPPTVLDSQGYILNDCINRLRKTSVEIREGIYIQSLAGTPISFTRRYQNINASRQTKPDGFAYYYLPIKTNASFVSTSDSAADVSKLYGHLKTLMQDKSHYIAV